MSSESGSVTLIVEPDPHGHRLYYVGLLIAECRSRGERAVVLTTESAADTDWWHVNLDRYAPEFLVPPGCGPVPTEDRPGPPEGFSLDEIATISRQLGARLTILPGADHYLTAAIRQGWRGSGRLSMLVMRTDAQPGSLPRWVVSVKTIGKRMLIAGADRRRGVRVFALRSALVARRGPLRWVPDPITLSCTSKNVREMRRTLDSQGVRYWFGVFGAMYPRKNLPLVVKALFGQNDVGLLLAGVIDTGVAREVAPLLEEFVAQGGRLVHLSGVLTEAEFDAAIGAVDCVVAAHSNEGSSAVVLKAAASGRRLVLAGAESLRRDAECLGDQASWSPLDLAAVRQALRQARCLPELAATPELGAGEFCRLLLSES